MAMREKALAMKTLVSLLQGMEGTVTTVEFRDDSSVTGKIDHVDGYMNIEMKDVTYSAANGVSQRFAKYCCQGKYIRYVHIPDEIDPIKTIEDRLEVLSKIRPGRGRGGRGMRGGRGRGGRGGGRRGGGGGGGGGGYGARPSSSRGGYGAPRSGGYGGGGYGGSSYGGGGSSYGGGGSYGSYSRRY